MSESFFPDQDIVSKYFPDKDGPPEEDVAGPPAEEAVEPETPEKDVAPLETGPPVPETPPPPAEPETEPAPEISPPPVEPAPDAAVSPPTPPPPPSEATQPLLCGNCAVELDPQSRFCHECGAPVSMAVTSLPEPVPSVTGPSSAVKAVVPPSPPEAESSRPPRWPWMTLMIGGGILAMAILCCGCLVLFMAKDLAADGEFTVEGVRLFSLICCLVPGLLLVSSAVFGGVQAFRRPKE